MSKLSWNYLVLIPSLFNAILAVSTVASAESIPNPQPKSPLNSITEVSVSQLTSQTNSIGQVTSVSQLSDVKPTDWAFQALQSLVERYGVITGLPDGTFQGNRSLTRYEFAAGLNAALDKINEVVFTATEDAATKTDVATLQKLQEDFAEELTTLRGRVDKLDARVTKLEGNQFSTTTKLTGRATFLLADTFGERANGKTDDTNTTFSYQALLNLQTSFTGKDQLTTSLSAVNVPVLAGSTGTQQTRFNIDYSPSARFSDGSLFLNQLVYRFPVGKQGTVWVGARQLQPAAFLPTLNPLVGGVSGAVSRFSTFNPTIYRPGFDGAGAAFAYKFNDKLQFNAGYITDDTQANKPSVGVFKNNYNAIAQLTITPSPKLDVALTYNHKYFANPTIDSTTGRFDPLTNFNLTGGTGTVNAFRPFEQNATASDNFGLQFNWKAASTFHLGGWFGYTNASQVSGPNNSATIINGALTLAFPDLGKKGNLGGFVIGIPPKVTSSTYRPRVGAPLRQDSDTSLHLETFYTYKVNNNVSVTPNLFVIFNPEGNSANSPIWVGAVRTTFTF